MPTKYRKVPVEIEAMQYTLETRDEIIAWSGCMHTQIGDFGEEYETENLKIRTLEGVMLLKPGNWLIKGVEGEFYPCADSIFRRTYEIA